MFVNASRKRVILSENLHSSGLVILESPYPPLKIGRFWIEMKDPFLLNYPSIKLFLKRNINLSGCTLFFEIYWFLTDMYLMQTYFLRQTTTRRVPISKSHTFNKKGLNRVGKGYQEWPGTRTLGPGFWIIGLEVLCERSCLNPVVYMTWFKPCSKYMVIGERLPWVFSGSKRNDVCEELGMWWAFRKVHYWC